jgi:hypothetical protein
VNAAAWPEMRRASDVAKIAHFMVGGCGGEERRKCG